jgi:hypothetical protein
MRISGRAIERHDTVSAWLPIDGHRGVRCRLKGSPRWPVCNFRRRVGGPPAL